MKKYEVWAWDKTTDTRTFCGDDFETRVHAQDFINYFMAQDNHPDDMWIEESDVE